VTTSAWGLMAYEPGQAASRRAFGRGQGLTRLGTAAAYVASAVVGRVSGHGP
jgi:hypothetical protein